MNVAQPMQQRVLDPSRAFYAWRELAFLNGEVVPRGHRVPQTAIATLSAAALRQLFLAKHIDHAPVPNITPADQIEEPTVAGLKAEISELKAKLANAEAALASRSHKPQRAAG